MMCGLADRRLESELKCIFQHVLRSPTQFKNLLCWLHETL